MIRLDYLSREALDELRCMVVRLREVGFNDYAELSFDVLMKIHKFEAELAQQIDPLRSVWAAMDNWESGDWEFDAVAKTVREQRRRSVL